MEKDRERLEGGTKDIIQQKLKTKLVSGNAPSDYMWTIPGVIHSVRWLSKGKDDFTSIFAKLNLTPPPPRIPIPRATFEQFSYRDQLAKLKISHLLFLSFLFFLSHLSIRLNRTVTSIIRRMEDRSWPICFRVIASPKEIPGSINKFSRLFEIPYIISILIIQFVLFLNPIFKKNTRQFCKIQYNFVKCIKLISIIYIVENRYLKKEKLEQL